MVSQSEKLDAFLAANVGEIITSAYVVMGPAATLVVVTGSGDEFSIEDGSSNYRAEAVWLFRALGFRTPVEETSELVGRSISRVYRGKLVGQS